MASQLCEEPRSHSRGYTLCPEERPSGFRKGGWYSHTYECQHFPGPRTAESLPRIPTHTMSCDISAVKPQTLRTPGQCFCCQEVVIPHADTLRDAEGTQSA